MLMPGADEIRSAELVSSGILAGAGFQFIPTMNMWCAQTAALIKPIRTVAATIIG